MAAAQHALRYAAQSVSGITAAVTPTLHLDNVTAGRWHARQVAGLTDASARALFNNEVPAVRIAAFATARECRTLLDAIRCLEFRHTHFNPASVQRIGPSYFGFKDRKDEYFRAVGRFEEIRTRLALRAFDSTDRLAEIMAGAGLVIRRAYEPGFGHYAPCFIKKRTGSQLLHTDTAKMMDGWILGGNTSQVAWNLYLQLDEGRDATVVYDRVELPGDERYMSEEHDYFLEGVAEGANAVEVRPGIGDVILFNSYNYHRVRSTGKDRITIGGFLGESFAGEIGYWA